ncbi:uncharacterized protein M421DRAFT_2020 [Didymella exigua CBS 183.55]|uniref:Myb-like domain-containing protein n=1 Tax=Didymella exigua CBS 183.55 TaxID=1150837 RepID=A0A6A5RZD8_9PLEO|nr:uncharacterized protein M421DRAFT_2020 [Didymella exigua CBS 183.55]KAF1932388.1 hypothetical protein M421DRAFT_2020 [Didymella exigua CBS 183.55]
MSDSTKSPAPSSSVAAPTAKFSERELQILSWAMQSLKSGPPEIDNEKLAEFAGMTNPRSASNAWAALKKKLMAPADPNAPPPPTPKRGGGRKKKEADGEDGETTPKKTPRKRAAKEAEDGDASPKKKGRPAKAKPRQEPEDEDAKAKAEPDSTDSNDLKPEAGAEAEEEEV